MQATITRAVNPATKAIYLRANADYQAAICLAECRLIALSGGYSTVPNSSRV